MPISRSRINYLWYLLSWIILLSFTVIVYHFVTESHILRLDPSTWTLIDNAYKTLRGLLITAIIANLVSLTIREIKYGFWSDQLFIRKFLPTIKFIIILMIWIISSFLILENLQIDTSKLLTGAWIWWAIFALASKDIIANLLGSLSIILSKTFEIGDTIKIKGIEGIVEEINLNYTKVMSTEGKVVYIPNRTLNTENLENLTRRRFYLYIYKVPFKKNIGDPDKVHDMLMFIEWKIWEYSPIEIEIKSEIPNATDFVYIFEVKVPEENDDFDKEIREFLIPYIFMKDIKALKIENL